MRPRFGKRANARFFTPLPAWRPAVRRDRVGAAGRAGKLGELSMAEVFRFDRALARQPAGSAVDGLRAVDRGAPDMARFRAEHAAYVAALEQAGVAVEVLPPLE